MKLIVACHEDDVRANKTIAYLAALFAAPQREYDWRIGKGYRIGRGPDPLPELVVGGDGFRLADAAAAKGGVSADDVLITTYRPGEHKAFALRRPRNFFRLLVIVGGHDAPTVDGFRRIIFLREGVDADRAAAAAASQALHAFFTPKKRERFRNCSTVTAHDLVAPKKRRLHRDFVDDARSAAAI